jgi:hypothetical protein
MADAQQRIIDECVAQKKLYVDAEFPATAQSIGAAIDVLWLRPSEFMQGKPVLFSEGIAPDDILQGSLGDCYFLSSLSVLAERPKRIERLFRHDIANNVGVHRITLHPNGHRKDVIVDDLFPCSPVTRKPLFSGNKGPELWVMLLEKAYAKTFGSYKAIEAGSPAKALVDLTGAPVTLLKVREMEREALFTLICEHDRLDHVMCCSVPDVPERDLKAEVGLIEEHAYALIAAKQHKEHHLLQIRNPWGEVEWNGAWCDSDPRWTPELKKAFNWTNSDDGLFWMSIQDFSQFFDTIVVLNYNDSWHSTSHPFQFKAVQTVFTIKCEKDCELYLSLNQDLRSAEATGKQIVGMRFCLVQGGYPYKPLGGTKEAFTLTPVQSSERFKVQAGRYYVMVEVFKNHQDRFPCDAVFGVYSSEKVSIQDGAEEASAASSAAPAAAAAAAPFSFMLPEYVQKFGACAVCSVPLSGPVVNVANMKIHPYCFKCHVCNAKLGGQVVVKGGKFFCKPCAVKPAPK